MNYHITDFQWGNSLRSLIMLQVIIIVHACSQKAEEEDPCPNTTGNGNEIISGPAGPAGGDYDQVFRSLEVDPLNSDVLYMGTERNGIVKSVDGGVTWQRLRRGIRHSSFGYPEVWDIAVSPSNPQIVIAATADSPGPPGDDYPSSTAGIYISANGGNTWNRSDCGLTNSYALCVRFNPHNPSMIVLGIGAGKATFSSLLGQFFNGALMISTDNGTNWSISAAPAGADKNVFWILRSYGSGIGGFLTFGLNTDEPSTNTGFLRSQGMGQNWRSFAPSLQTRMITAFDVSADGQTIYAVERDAFSLFKTVNGGSSWDTLAVPANGPVRISPSNPDVVLFCEGEKVYRSANGIQSYDLVLTTMDRIDDIEFALSKPNIVYLAARGYHIYKSTDSGLTWSHLISLRSAGILQ